MWCIRILVSAAFISAICWPHNGIALTHPTPVDEDDPYQFLEVLKLDPVIFNALKVDLNDTLLQKLRRDSCFQRAIFLAKMHRLMEIDKYNMLDLKDHLKLITALPDHLMELLEKPTDRAKCHELRLASFKPLEKLVAKRCAEGKELSETLNTVKAARLTAEIEYLKFKEQLEKPKK